MNTGLSGKCFLYYIHSHYTYTFLSMAVDGSGARAYFREVIFFCPFRLCISTRQHWLWVPSRNMHDNRPAAPQELLKFTLSQGTITCRSAGWTFELHASSEVCLSFQEITYRWDAIPSGVAIHKAVDALALPLDLTISRRKISFPHTFSTFILGRFERCLLRCYKY